MLSLWIACSSGPAEKVPVVRLPVRARAARPLPVDRPGGDEHRDVLDAPAEARSAGNERSYAVFYELSSSIEVTDVTFVDNDVARDDARMRLDAGSLVARRLALRDAGEL